MATVIIADDSSFMRGSLKHIVQSIGHSVLQEAKDGKEAWELYREIRPDLVIMDILMEGMDGLGGLKAIKDEDPEAKVIIISALGQEEKQEQARLLGASGYIRKPFTVEEIQEEVSKVLGDKRQGDDPRIDR